MRETDYITLELYLDGELPEMENALLEQRLLAEQTLSQALAHLKQARTLRLAALESYTPDAAEAQRLADGALAYCRENQYAPIGRILESSTTTVWLKRLGMAAACVLIAAGSYFAGRGSVTSATQTATAPAASSIIGYTVQISTPSGQVVSQRFATYQQAKAFAQTYTADEQAVSNRPIAAPQVASASNTGVF